MLRGAATGSSSEWGLAVGGGASADLVVVRGVRVVDGLDRERRAVRDRQRLVEVARGLRRRPAEVSAGPNRAPRPRMLTTADPDHGPREA